MGRLLPRIVVAGTETGVGKTTVTLGLMAAFAAAGRKVQGFKVGPDFIDPGHHAQVTGRVSRNLDPWMMGADGVKRSFEKGMMDAELAVIEGVMGLYDGKDPRSDDGSTAEVAVLLQAPVVLVVNAAGMARSAAALVEGYRRFRPDLHLAGVIVNRVGGEGHFRLLQDAIESRGIPVWGWLSHNKDFHMSERHLGLVPAAESGHSREWFERLGEWLKRTIDLEAVTDAAQAAPPLPAAPREESRPVTLDRTRIAVARDAAFHFYYPENLERMERLGAELLFFRPLKGDPVPEEADGVLIGGGYPELFAGVLTEKREWIDSLRRHWQKGLPVWAECGGYMALAQVLVDKRGRRYPMAGLIPGEVWMQEGLAGFGYEAMGGPAHPWLKEGERVRGHEFHHSSFVLSLASHAYQWSHGTGLSRDGYAGPHWVTAYLHPHLDSCPLLAERFVRACAQQRGEKGKRR